jgi:hypothetical protein
MALDDDSVEARAQDHGERHAIRFSIGCALIIQTILLDPSRAIWTDEAPNLSRLDPSEAVQSDAEHPPRNRKVEGSNPSGSKTAGQNADPASRARTGRPFDQSFRRLAIVRCIRAGVEAIHAKGRSVLPRSEELHRSQREALPIVSPSLPKD